jgi:hypothetical protein
VTLLLRPSRRGVLSLVGPPLSWLVPVPVWWLVYPDLFLVFLPIRRHIKSKKATVSLPTMPRPKAKEPDRVLICGRPDFDRCDNQVTTARYTALTFLPVVRSR